MLRLRITLVALLIAVLVTGLLSPLTANGATTKARPSWAPVADASAGFSAAIVRQDQATAKQYLADSLRVRIARTPRFTLLGIQNAPQRYWYWVDAVNGTSARVTATYFLAGGQVADRISWIKTSAGWRITQITPVTSPAAQQDTLHNVVHAFNQALIRGDNAAAKLHLTGSAAKQAEHSPVARMLGLDGRPGSYTYTVIAMSASTATVRLSHQLPTKVVTNVLHYTKTGEGWRIAGIERMRA